MLTLNADGSFTYTPDAGFTGRGQLHLSADGRRDGWHNGWEGDHPGQATGASLDVADDQYTARHDRTLGTNAVTGVLANDSVLATGKNAVVVDQTTTHGTLNLNTTTGRFTYKPDAGFYGTDTFTYHLVKVRQNSADRNRDDHGERDRPGDEGGQLPGAAEHAAGGRFRRWACSGTTRMRKAM